MHSHLHTPYNASTHPQSPLPPHRTAPHLLTKSQTDCEEIMNALDECHARGFLYKAIGNCNDIKRDVNRCLGAERYARAKRNRDQARENRKRVERIWEDERALAVGGPGAVSSGSTASGTASGAGDAKQ